MCYCGAPGIGNIRDTRNGLMAMPYGLYSGDKQADSKDLS